MGFRFRKSVNFGGFRINLSKTGIGYSFGVPGFRWTKLANGRTRTTASIPGTGLSYVKENSRQKSAKQTTVPQLMPGQHLSKTTTFSPEKYESTDSEVFLNALKRYKYRQVFLKTMILTSALCCLSLEMPFFILLILFCMLSLYVFLYNRVNVEFIYDEHSQEKQSNINSVLEILRNSHRAFEAKEVYSNNNTKYTGGAGESIKGSKFSVKKRRPPFMKINNKCYSVFLNGKKLYFLPNGILVNSLFDLYLLSIKDLRIHLEETMYIEFGTPKDSELIKHTWLYVNKQGGPDRRFKNNLMLNGNRYGVIQFQIPEVLDLIVCFSNYKAVPELERLAKCIAGKNVTRSDFLF